LYAHIHLSVHHAAVCETNRHVRTWRLTRFRGRVSTQPGAVPLASFELGCEPAVTTLGSHSIPLGDRNERQILVQVPASHPDRILLRDACLGSSICSIRSVDASFITAVSVHECDTPSRFGSRPRRFFITGHDTGAVQVWDLLVALDMCDGAGGGSGNSSSSVNVTGMLGAVMSPSSASATGVGSSAAFPGMLGSTLHGDLEMLNLVDDAWM
jgi:hypothetical protein